MATELPIEAVLPDLRRALEAGPSAVLQAPTGAGKTTRVPQALLNESWLEGRRIVMLEPRRLAARAAARRMAHLRGEKPGQTIGYRVRMDTRVGPETRIEVVTEGVLTQMVQRDPALEGIGCVIFDEFHERSLQADLGLALCLEARSVLRPALRMVVMSATLEAAPVAALLDDAPLITSEGRSYSVETHYLERQAEGRIEAHAARAARCALDEEPQGDVLVFQPGAGEIRRTQQRLEEGGLPEHVELHPLFGNLPQQAQDRAIAPGAAGRRKVVLATDIAETSLTIEGVRAVIDSGLSREPRFSPRSGMTRLDTVRVSKASAEQRRGRAGRLGPGVCYRLWTRHRQQHLRPHTAPEITVADLAPLALELARWGTPDPSRLRWLDPPPEAAYAQAQDLLRRLDAVGAEGLPRTRSGGRITDHGRRMAGLGLHPRLAHMLLRGEALDLGPLACDLAVLLSERDVFKGRGQAPEADLRLRLEALRAVRRGERPHAGHMRGYTVDGGACRHVLRVARHWRRKMNLPDGEGGKIEACGLLLAFAYPDRVARQRDGQPGRFTGVNLRFRLRNGRPATLPEAQLLAGAPYLVAAHLGGRRRTARIFLAAPVTLDDLTEHFSSQIDTVELVQWDGEAQRVRARRQERLGALVLKDGPLRHPDPEKMAEALLEGIEAEGLDLLPWTKAARRTQQRMQFMHHQELNAPEAWPDVSDDALLRTLADWLKPHLYGLRRADDLQRVDLADVLRGRLSWEQRNRLDRWAPTHLEVPSGSRRPIDYSDPDAPVLAVRLQEMFGATRTPRIAGGRVPLTLHLLSPAQRPAQITQDLAGFWETTYFDVKKDLKGRYPKHYWPDDPLTATPTSRVRPRR